MNVCPICNAKLDVKVTVDSMSPPMTKYECSCGYLKIDID